MNHPNHNIHPSITIFFLLKNKISQLTRAYGQHEYVISSVFLFGQHVELVEHFVIPSGQICSSNIVNEVKLKCRIHLEPESSHEYPSPQQ